MSTYQFHLRSLAIRRYYYSTAGRVISGAAGLVILSWIVFSLLLSTWHLTDPSQGGHKIWSASSILILALAAIYLTRELLRLAGVGARPLSQSSRNGGGSPPGTPLAGAPCPVPIRPTPHLVRSAAKRLPSEKRNPVDIISRDTL